MDPTYNPLGSTWLSTAVAALPIVLLLGSLGLLGWSAPKAAALRVALALAVAIFAYGMPWHMAIASAAYGAAFGLFPIGWIVLAAIFLYSLTVQTGQFEIVKASVVGLSADRPSGAADRFQLRRVRRGSRRLWYSRGDLGRIDDRHRLLAVACSRLGADRQHGVAFGALGTPIITLADVTQLDEMKSKTMN